ncbi:MAG: ribonuclease P protein component [Sulfuritalea sp.]|nr:ribonuclease P protein component [Sulfuritalea sp.]
MPRAVIVSLSKRTVLFGPDQRLHRPGEFKAVMAARRVVRSSVFDLHYCLAAPGAKPRLGLIVPKRLARAASLRNAIKRQGREAFRLVASEFPPCDLVLRLKAPVKGLRASDVAQKKNWRAEVENLFRRLPLDHQ